MNQTLLHLYHSLPPPLQSVAASLRGVYLRSWRYGPDTKRLVREALERENWSYESWKKWQEQQLAFVLHRAAREVPYYREYWLERRRKGDNASPEYLENWPILEKDILRKNPKRFLAEDCSLNKMFHEHTSGTTGIPLHLWWSSKTVQSWYALFEARCRVWNGISLNDRWAILGGQLVTAVAKRQPPFWVWNAALKQLYMSSYHLASDLLPHYLDALNKFGIRYLFGYTSALYELAHEILAVKRKDLKMAVVVTNAEPLFDYQREAISEAFQCQVRETYGMAEIVAAASECNEGTLHLWPEVGLLEVFENDHAVSNGNIGDLVCTGLLNVDMPLIRYRVGDRARLSNKHCTCGRALDSLASLEGRIDDVLYTLDGRRIGRLDPVFKYGLPLREAQVIQEGINVVRVRYVASAEFTNNTGRLLVRLLQERIGPMNVILEQVDKIPRGANGKFRAVINTVQLPQ